MNNIVNDQKARIAAMGRKPVANLRAGDEFTYRGKRAWFGRWVSNGYAQVRNADGHVVRWTMNMAGSVEVHPRRPFVY